MACTISLPTRLRPKLSGVFAASLRDVILDLRPESSTFGQSIGVDLTAENRCMMYIPKGFAHGFLTLAEVTEAFYLIDEFYDPEYGRGIRWNDPNSPSRGQLTGCDL